MDHLPENLATLKPEQILALRARAKSDKLWLATEVLGYDHQPDVHQELFDQFIRYDPKKPWVEQSEIRKRMILWFRGAFKSSTVAVDIIQLILNFPDARVLLMQGSLKTTRRLLRELASHFTGEARSSRLVDLFPDYCGVVPPSADDDDDRPRTGRPPSAKKLLQLTADSFTTPARVRKQLQQATVTVASPRAVKTGQHYDALYADDLVNDSNYRSETQLEKTWEDYTMCLPLLDPPYYVVMTGTRYAHTDLYARIIRQNEQTHEWMVSIKTCWSDDGKEVRFPRRQTKDGRYIGTTREELLNLKLTDPAVFASQYLLQPASTARQTFTDEQLEARVVIPALAPASLSAPLMYVDLAHAGDRSDDCVILLAKVDHLGKVYVTFCRGGQWDTHTLAKHILDVCMRIERPQMIFFEKSAAGRTYVDYLRLYCSTLGVTLPLDFLPSDVRPDAKRIRVDSLQGYFRTDRLYFFAGLESWTKLKEQFVKWTGEKGNHDDYPDTVALCMQYYAQNVPLIRPLSAEQFPFMRMIEQYGTPMDSPLSQPENVSYENDMGDFFSC